MLNQIVSGEWELMNFVAREKLRCKFLAIFSDFGKGIATFHFEYRLEC